VRTGGRRQLKWRGNRPQGHTRWLAVGWRDQPPMSCISWVESTPSSGVCVWEKLSSSQVGGEFEVLASGALCDREPGGCNQMAAAKVIRIRKLPHRSTCQILPDGWPPQSVRPVSEFRYFPTLARSAQYDGLSLGTARLMSAANGTESQQHRVGWSYQRLSPACAANPPDTRTVCACLATIETREGQHAAPAAASRRLR